MIRFIRSINNNTFVFAFVVYFLGFLSLSFLGEENKIIRITTTLLVLFVLLIRLYNSHTQYYKSKLSTIIFIYTCTLLPSLIFSELFFMSAFKILDIFIIYLLINESVRNFYIKELKITLFDFILYYFVVQCIIIIGGYFFDPHAMRSDLLQKGVSFLSSNYPKIHSNTVGTFGGVVILFSIFRIKRVPQRTIINLLLLSLGLAVVYLSSSRTGMIATLIGAIFLIAMIFSGKQKIYLLTAASIGLVIFTTEIYQFGYKALMKMQTEETLANSNNATDLLLSGRLSLWETIMEKPENLIFGRGFGTALLSENAMNNTNAHNSIVELMVNAGIVAVILWITIWWYLFKYYRYIINNKKFLTADVSYYHFSFSLLILIFIKSMANITFVYFQLFDWLMVSIFCLYICTELKIKQTKIKLKKQLATQAVIYEEA